MGGGGPEEGCSGEDRVELFVLHQTPNETGIRDKL